jgi:hypothetical protein
MVPIDAALLWFGGLTGAGFVLALLGGRLRDVARQREQGGMQIMTVKRDNPESQRGAFDALRAEVAGLQVMIPGVPSLPTRPIDYEGWFADVGKRIQMRSEQRTLDEQIKIQSQYDQLYRQYLSLMKTAYEIAQTSHDFGQLGEKVSLDEKELKVRGKEINIRLKELDLRGAELDVKIKQAREKKLKSQEQPEEERFREKFKTAKDIDTIRRIEKEEVAKYPVDADLQARIHRIAHDLCERLTVRGR